MQLTAGQAERKAASLTDWAGDLSCAPGKQRVLACTVPFPLLLKKDLGCLSHSCIISEYVGRRNPSFPIHLRRMMCLLASFHYFFFFLMLITHH